MRVGVFGGTFDPPHLGHLILGAEACDQLGLERLLWVLTPNPPHKVGLPVTALVHRLAMLERSIADEPAFVLSRVDIERPPPHYACETVSLLAGELPGAELFYLIGGDSLRELPTWHRPDDLVKACTGLGVMRRPADGIDLEALDAQIPGLKAKTIFINAPLLEIASSDIRQRISKGKPYRYYLHPDVYAYINDQGLYSGDRR